MYKLKTLRAEAIPAALKKAERYRLLNEPFEAESICLDILNVEPDNQEALIMLILALTDKFGMQINPAFDQARELLSRLNDDHCRAYYSGIIYERRAKTHLQRGEPGSGQLAHGWFTKAMQAYETAFTTCSPGNQDAALRWNTCARLINDHPHVIASEEAGEIEMLE